MRLTFLISVAISQIGVAYKWGGSNPLQGFDCSGFVQWVLRSAGIDPPGDQTAQALYNAFERDSTPNSYTAGALAFYGKSVSEITHVGLLIDPYRMIEAGGGGKLTLTREDAAACGACVRVSLVKSRKDLVAVLKPRYAAIGIL